MPAPRLSLAMIVKDEAATVARVLDDAAAFCDELVVIDTGSSDATVEIAEVAGARVLHFEWVDDFAAARNFSFEQCKGEWIIWLDADDRVPQDVQATFRAMKSQWDVDTDAFFVPYRYHYDSTGTHCLYSYFRERVIRSAAGLRWQGAVHEVLAVPLGRGVLVEDVYVEHRPDPARRALNVDRNLGILQKQIDSGDRSPRTLFYYGNELRDHQRYEDALRIYREYLDCEGPPVWERYAALMHMHTCVSNLGHSDEALGYAFTALRLDPARAEAFMRVGVYYYERDRFREALPFFAAATSMQRPSDGFIDDAMYSFLPWDYLSICYDRTGRRADAVDATMRALETSPDQDRLLANLAHFVKGVS